MQNLTFAPTRLSTALYEHITLRLTCNEKQRKMLDTISAAISYAWENWDEEIIRSYYNTQADEIPKPELPNNEFLLNWLENEDFAADGYDTDYLNELFL